MAVNLDWSLLGPLPDIGGAFRRGMEQGDEQAKKRVQENALAALARDRNDPRAVEMLWRVNPSLAASYETHSMKRADWQREGEFRGAVSDYLVGQQNGGLAQQRAAAPAPTQNALAPLVGGKPQPSMQARPTGVSLAEMGSQPTPRPARTMTARERAIRANPEKFLTYEGKRIDIDSDRIKQMLTLNDGAMQILGGVHDDETLLAAKERARALYQRFGMPTETIDQIPDTYSPELVRSLQMQGMDTAKQLQQVVRENRLEWDIQDDLEDNERADRNTNSMVETRQGQLANTRRGQDLTNSRGVRGQNIASRDRVRGQDIGSRDRVRGQDITDKRTRESASFRGTGGKRGRAATARIVNPQTGEAMVLRNGQWVKD